MPRFQRRVPVSRLPPTYDSLREKEIPEEKVEQWERSYQLLKENELMERINGCVKKARETEMSEKPQLALETHRERGPVFQSPRRSSSLSPPKPPANTGFAQTMTNERYFSEISPVRHIKEAPNSFENVLKRSPNVSRLLSNYQQRQNQRERVRHASQSSRVASASLAVDPFEDRDFNTSHIVDFAKSGFNALHRIVVIALKMTQIILSPLLSPQLVWIVPAVLALCVGLYGMSYGLSYVTSDSGYSPPAEPAQDLSEINARLLPLESHLYSLSQKFATFEPWIKSMVQKADDRVSHLEDKLEDELTKVSEALSTLNHKVDKFADWAQSVDAAIKRHDDGLEKLQRIVSSQADDFNELFDQINSNQNMNSNQNFLENLQEFETRITQQLADDRGVVFGRMDMLELKINSLQLTNPEFDESVVSTLRQALQQQLSEQIADLDSKVEKSQARTNELLAAQRDSIAAVNRRLRDVVSVSGPSLDESAPKHSTLRMDRPNFLDPKIGARVDLSLTSTPFNPYTQASLPYRAVRDAMGFLGFGRVHFNTADMALYSNTEVGNCWPFQGRAGTLAVELPCAVLVDSVAVEHPFYKQLVNPTTAPRTMSLWGRIDDPEFRKQVQSVVGSDPQTAGLPENYVKLASFEYDLYKGEQWQLFDVPREIQRLEIPVRHVVFKFENNWGSPQVSCIYRLQLFGTQAGSLQSDHYESIKDNEYRSRGSDRIVVSQEDTGFGDDEEILND